MTDNRPVCKYHPNCYQKNQEHKSKYLHPPVKNFKIFDMVSKKKKRKLENEHRNENSDDVAMDSFENKLKQPKITDNDDAKDVEETCFTNKIEETSSDTKEKEILNEIDSPKNNNSQLDSIDITEKENQQSGDDYHEIPLNVEEFIEDKFLVKMPTDFCSFWEFLKLNPKYIDYLKKINLKLVGPFDVLLGKLPIKKEKLEYVLHWRHFYDPPEFQTVLMSTKDEFHIGYYRDSPSELPCFLAYNNGNDCKIYPIAENLFGTLISYIQMKGKDFANVFVKSDIELFAKDIKKFANENKFTLESNSLSMKKRLKAVVSKTFHGAGIVVPYNRKTQLGYRPLIEKDDVIKKIFKDLVNAESDDERNAVRARLQPILTMASIATDECDFGTGLELGINLFCYGEEILHNQAKHYLTIAYNMLDREPFGEIIKMHLKHRRKGSSLSIVDM